MKHKGQLKGTLFSICIFIIVLVSVFSFVELSSNIDLSQEGILIDLENDTEKNVSIIINGVYQYRIFPWIYKDQFHGNISIVTEDQKIFIPLITMIIMALLRIDLKLRGRQ